jgi:endogenous inhibitor of DNA gyrase (YacG/DUF329 family)
MTELAYCVICGKQLRSATRQFCSIKCRVEGRKVKVEKRNCKYCGKELTKKQILQRQIMCSKRCANLNQMIEIKQRNCEVCGKSLDRKQLLMKQRFCSIKCKGIGIHHYHVTKKRISPLLGKPRNLTDIQRRELSLSVSKAKTGIKRAPFSEEWKKNIGLAQVGRKHSLETREKISRKLIGNKGRKGQPIPEAQREKIRRSVSAHWATVNPSRNSNYNPRSIPFFEELDKVLGSKGFYGTNEFLIEELGYFPDYINFEAKLIVEWDEEHHFRKERVMKRDLKRQQEIQAHYPDFRFCRIRESYYLV